MQRGLFIVLNCSIIRKFTMKPKARAVTLLLVSLAGCQTAAQQQFSHMNTDMSSTNDAVKACNLTVSSKPEYSALFAHAPWEGRPSLAQLADQTKITDRERTLFIALASDYEPCRQIRLDGLSKVDRRAGDVLSASYVESDKVRVDLIQRKIGWGEYVTKMTEIANRRRSNLQEAEQNAVNGLNAQHQQELARRAAVAQQMSEYNQRQQLINSMNRPVNTSCSRFGNQVNCTTY